MALRKFKSRQRAEAHKAKSSASVAAIVKAVMDEYQSKNEDDPSPSNRGKWIRPKRKGGAGSRENKERKQQEQTT